ncbi:TetR/AcrR family transcriptional regulator [Burkholderia multivorans]
MTINRMLNEKNGIMKHGRLTREQRRSETRERLIDAARTMFLKKGFADTSVENIAGTAGYTRGAFYANFDSKRELLIELLHRDHNRMLADLQAMASDRAPDESASRAAAYYAASDSNCSCFPLWVEAKLLGLRDAGIRTILNALRLEQLRLFGACIHRGSALAGSSRLATVDATALGLLFLCDGIRIARMDDRESITDEVAEALLDASFPSTLSRSPES